MTPEAREMLDQLDEFFVSEAISGLSKSQLWDVLSALRGPDMSDSHQRKVDTTIPIRRAAFPKLTDSRHRHSISAAFGYDDSKYNGPTKDSSAPHFEYHVAQAAYALGLI